MRHPLESIPAARRKLVLSVLLAITFALMAVLLSVDRFFPPGIVAFEFARGDDAARMMSGWDATARAFVGFSLGLDYVYLCAYSCTIGLACIMVGETLRERGAPAVASMAIAFAWMQWLAAACDAIENAALLHTLTRNYPRMDSVSWACASAKFALVALGVLYVIVGGGLALAMRLRSR